MNDDAKKSLDELRESIRRLTEPPTFLVVEDVPSDRELLGAELLRFFGKARLVECATGDEALRLLGEIRFDAVFLDLRLHGMSGTELMGKLPTGPKPALIIITGLPEDAEQTLLAIRLGAVKVIAKPVRQEDLAKLFGSI